MPEQQQDRGQSFWWTAVQSVGIFFAIQAVIRQIAPQAPAKASSNNETTVTATTSGPIGKFAERPDISELQGPYSKVPQRLAPIWDVQDPLDLRLYVSPSFQAPSPKSPGSAKLILNEENFRYGAWDDKREVHTSFPVPREVQQNGTLWSHFFIGLHGSVLDPADRLYDSSKAYHFARPLSQHLKKKKIAKVRNLLSKSESLEPVPEERPVFVPFYHPNFTLSFIPDSGIMTYNQGHAGILEWIVPEKAGARDLSGQNGWYYPVLYVNTFWQLRDHMIELNSSVTELPINIQLNSWSFWKFSALASIDFGMKDQRAKAARGESIPGGGDGSEMEELKRILLDSNLYLLGTTVVVGILHSIFELLAFKNDVSHWRNKKDNIGVSVRTILANVFMQIVIFLYLLDNSDNTSWMILFSQIMGIALEAWKVTKTVNVRIRPTTSTTIGIWKYLPYEVKFEDKHKLSETEKKTQEYDQIAFKYMYIIFVPLIIAYAVYSLYYESHKSWYSFTITTLVGSVYAYGFLLMLPSLYINYRLKSVAHMPGKAMTYKVLGTFIDDLFAFTIKMPTLHRLATLRDDVVFFIYVYQNWKYKTDFSRVNEFGQGGDDDKAKPAAAVADVVENKLKKDASLAEPKESAATTGRESGSAKKRR